MDSEDGHENANTKEAFALLSHEIRLDILLALLADWEAARTEPVSYATLMDAVGIEDSGKFNYHLDKLRDIYVQQVDTGYVPAASATALYRDVLAHQPMDTFTIEPYKLDMDCPACGETTTLTYERGFVTIDCRHCEEWLGFTAPFPQNGVEQRDTDELLAAIDTRFKHHAELLRNDQCPDCAGTVAVDLRPEAFNDEPFVGVDCRTCSLTIGLDVLGMVRGDDRVAEALRTVGVDPSLPIWELPAGTAFVDSHIPPRVGITIEAERGTVTVVVDETLDIVSMSTETTPK